MTATAFDRVQSLPVRSALDSHRVRVTVISLTRKVAGGVAIHAATVPQDGNDVFESSSRSILRERLSAGIEYGEKRDKAIQCRSQNEPRRAQCHALPAK
jgi:hypothetical protein